MNLWRYCMGRKGFKAERLICQAQMDTATACRHSLDVVVQALMKERSGRASTGGCAPHLVLLPLRSLFYIRLLCQVIICVQTPMANRRGWRLVCTGAYSNCFSNSFWNSAALVWRTLMLDCCSTSRPLKPAATTTSLFVFVRELKLTLRVTSRLESEWLPAGLCVNEAGQIIPTEISPACIRWCVWAHADGYTGCVYCQHGSIFQWRLNEAIQECESNPLPRANARWFAFDP